MTVLEITDVIKMCSHQLSILVEVLQQFQMQVFNYLLISYGEDIFHGTCENDCVNLVLGVPQGKVSLCSHL